MNAPLTTGTARVVDPILTNHARGFRHPEHVGMMLFPDVPMAVRGMKRIEFRKESFQLYNSKRAPGAATKRIKFGYDGKPVDVEQHRLEGEVAVEHVDEAAAVPGIDLASITVDGTLRSISLNREVDSGTIARDLNNYDVNHKLTLAGASRWNDPTSDPKGDINAGREAIRATIGLYPNTLILGPQVFTSLDVHPNIVDKFKFTSSDSLTEAMLANYFNIPNIGVGKSIYYDPTADAFVDIWGKDAVLAWVPPANERNVQNPAYGYTYHLPGRPFAEAAYQERNANSWYYPVQDEFSVEQVGPEAGFLIKTAVD